MDRRTLAVALLLLALVLANLPLGIGPVSADQPPPDKELHFKGKVTPAEKDAAGQRFAAALAGAQAAGLATDPPGHIVGADGLPIPHYFGPYPNYALSELPTVTTDMTGTVISVTNGIRKFVDGLPGLGPDNANNLGQYLPVAIADTTTYTGSDYYEIALVEYEEQMHTDLGPTKLRGYVQLSTSVVTGTHVPLSDTVGSPILLPNGSQAYGVDKPHYLGPVIVAQKDRPVRVKFYNLLPTGAGGDLFIPVDKTVMGSGMGPVMDGAGNPVEYTQNRATIHLHGGHTPWISDGTPHQWTTPANENTPYPEGVSVYNVPDMPDPGPGALTFFYTNQQSSRLMFYHDHAVGITRLNVNVGEAAGYLIRDAVEQDLITRGIIPGPENEIPLIIQDKTFIPDNTGPFVAGGITYTSQMAFYDPTWDIIRSGTVITSWGGPSDLWYPHVYMTVQNPYDISGINAFGRWHYGPWFWPPTTAIANPPVDNPYYDPVNAPWEPPQIPGTPSLSNGMESFFDTPVVNGTAYPYLEIDPKTYRFRILNAANDRFWNLQLYVADSTVTSFDGRVNTEVKMVPAASTSNLPASWPADGREGGVPDPLSIGPAMIQIGTEGGFLPKPVVLPNQPIAWNLDPTTFNFGNVESGNLILGPAERADVIIDFSAYRGKTLILYNDSPAPFPALAPQYDYYTGAPDLTDTGGSPGTQPGYGPNTRTIMQIRVADVAPSAPFSMTALNEAFVPTNGSAGVFQRGQEEIIVAQAAYEDVYTNTVPFPTTYPYWGISRIQDTQISFQTVSGQLVNNFAMQPKSMHDEMGAAFETEYGRMNSNLGLELPKSSANAANFILYPYLGPPVEIVPIGAGNDGTQIWKITHNGVDTHPIHFHLFEVQLLNRVGWDGAIRLPDPNELGWKDVVRVSPLEDTIVALRPVTPVLPFEVPNSQRLLDPTKLDGAPLDGVPGGYKDPLGNPVSVFNHIVNLGWEYVWHCHILTHEEMDMMHSVVYVLPPNQPTNLVATDQGSGANRRIVLTWQDRSLNETDWDVQRATSPTGPWATIASVRSTTGSTKGQATHTDPVGNIKSAVYYYRVQAVNVAGDRQTPGFPTASVVSGFSNIATFATVPTTPAPPSNVTAAAVLVGANARVNLTWTDNSNNETGFRIQRATNATFTANLVSATVAAGVTTFQTGNLAHGTQYYFRVQSFNSGGPSAWADATPLPITTP